MKFCKCVDQPQEYEKIVRLIEGGQELAALDRVNQHLAKTPNAAWLLAIKGELALSLREIDTFKDTAQRFLKLKPNNPLALIMRSFQSLLDHEPLDSAARLLLEGLAESREGMPRLAVTSTQLLCDQLRGSQKAPLRFFWSRLMAQFRDSAGVENEQEEALPLDNLLAMSPVPITPTPSGAQWTERSNEVAALISAFRHAQAETKLRSILRDYPDQPDLLTRLLEVQSVLLDQEGATATARKLGGLRTLPEADRDYFAALALEIENGQPALRIGGLSLYCEIDSEEAARERLAKVDDVAEADQEMTQGLKQLLAVSVEDEVPARAVFNVSVQRQLASGEHVKEPVGFVALFGRQTDKPARALIVCYGISQVRPQFEKIVAALGSGAELPDPSAPRTFHYLEMIDRGGHRSVDGKPVPLTLAERSEGLIDSFCSLPFPALEGLTPLDAVEQEPRRAMVRALLTHLEGAHHLMTEPGTIERLYQRLGFERPRNTLASGDEDIQARTFLDLTRIDVSQLSERQLGQLFATALAQDIVNLGYCVSQEVLKRPRSEALDSMRASALNVLSQYASTAEEMLSLLEQLEEALVGRNLSPGSAIMRRYSVLEGLGRGDEARDTLATAFRKYPNDPYLTSVWQYIGQQIRRSQADASVDDRELLSRMVRHSEPEPESGLVLPGQSSAPEGGQSKLWLPGS
jgi:hypothetical protein